MVDAPPPAKRARYNFKGPRQITYVTNRNRYNFKDTFEVLAGEQPNQQRFIVHRELFVKRSKFLEAASSSRWTCGVNKPVDLTEHEPEIFDSYMQCVYLGSVTAPELPNHAGGKALGSLVMLYLLAEKLKDVATTNLVIDEIMWASEEHHELPCDADVTLAYTSTVAGNPLRNLCRDYYVYEAPPDELVDIHRGKFPSQFLQDVILELKRLATEKEPGDRRRMVRYVMREKCCYHQHDDEHPRCS